jgi:acyl-coenzyme A thioesterase PaaI-like protein
MDPTQLLGLIPFNRHVGLEVMTVEPGRGVSRLREAPALVNHVGTLHAGVLFTLADAASGAAVVGLFADAIAETVLLVRDADITFVKLARGTLTAVATASEPRVALDLRLAQAGRTDTTVDVSIRDEDDAEVARVRLRWHLKRRPSS